MVQIDASDMLETAREHFREGNYKISEAMLQQLLISDARNPEIYHMLATIFYDQGKFNKAIKTFKRALEIDPTYTDASVGLSIILNDLGRYEEGRKVFAEAQRILDRKRIEGDSFFNERLAAKHDELGELYFQTKRYEDAKDQFLRSCELTVRKSDIKLKYIECLIKLGETDLALQELRSQLAEDSEHIPTRLKLGIMYFNAKKVPEAVEQWETVLAKDPENTSALRYLQMAQASRSTLLG